LEETRAKARKAKEEQRNAKMLSKGKTLPTDETFHQMQDEDDDDDGSLAILEDALQEASEELDEEDNDESSSVIEQRRRQDKQTFMADLLEIKEKKVLASRDTAAYHRELSPYEAYSKAAWFTLGWRAARVKEVGTKDKDVTLILPWLLLGRKELSSNLSVLFRLGITHILNVTHDVANLFPTHFVYMKISVKDNNEADMSRHFKRIVDFIARAERCKGRILVHCTAGASRAPTAVMAYLVAARNIPLVDAFEYVRALRPLANPNNRFLLQLALLEAELGEGVSVYFSKHWRFFEFNIFRAQGLDTRARLGLARTVWQLAQPVRDANDLLH